MEELLLSVIVPVYNVEEYLPRCLDSILAQDFKNYELILVDDGSPDNSAAIMEDYARRDPRIRQIHKENGGLSTARNAGLDMARGKYVVFLDSDDYIEPHLFADAVRVAEETGAEQVMWNYQKVDDTQGYGPYLKIEDEILDVDAMGLENYFYRYWMTYKHGQEACMRLFRRSVIEENGLRFQLNREIFAEDTLFTTMYLLHTHKIAAMSGVYYNYYTRSGSIMNSPKPQLTRRMTTLAVCLCEYARKVGKDRELKNVLPVLSYSWLICKGISRDASMEDVYTAMEAYGQNETVRELLHSLLGVKPLLKYTLKTGKGQRMQLRARMFAWRWLHGDVKGAAALVERLV